MIKKSLFKFKPASLLVCLILAMVHCIKDDPTSPNLPAQSNVQAVMMASNALMIGYSSPDTFNRVTTDVLLTNMASNGVRITWTSSHPEFISANGEVTRPTFAQGTTDVTLMATLFKGMVTNTKSFTLTVLAEDITDAEAVSNAISDLMIGYSSPDTFNRVTTDVLLTNMASNGVRITWTSSYPEFISANGEVTRPTFAQGTTDVTLMATLFKGMVTNAKTFILTVLAEDLTDAEAVSNASNALRITYSSPDTFNRVTTDVLLTNMASNGVRITWMSSHPAFISTNGEVMRPPFAQGRTRVTLMATLFKGMVTNTKTFILTVLPLADPDIAIVSNASNALMIGYNPPDISNGVMTDVLLTNMASNGVRITWMSSHPAFISANGEVMRPPFAQGRTRVTLMATLFKGMVTNTKTFILTVHALPDPDIAIVLNASNALRITYSSPDTSNRVTTDVLLTNMASNGVRITWMSSHPEFISTNGEVTRPTFAQGTTRVTLTAMLFKGMVTNTRSFTLTVLSEDPTDAEAVSSASNALMINPLGISNRVRSSLRLPITNTNYGVSITWMSSAQSIISTNGEVIPPSRAQGDTNVILTAILSKGAITNRKTLRAHRAC